MPAGEITQELNLQETSSWSVETRHIVGDTVEANHRFIHAQIHVLSLDEWPVLIFF